MIITNRTDIMNMIDIIIKFVKLCKYLVIKIKYNKIYKKSDMLIKKFNEGEFLLADIPSEFNISENDLYKMQELNLCKVMSFTNQRNKYKMENINEIIR